MIRIEICDLEDFEELAAVCHQILAMIERNRIENVE